MNSGSIKKSGRGSNANEGVLSTLPEICRTEGSQLDTVWYHTWHTDFLGDGILPLCRRYCRNRFSPADMVEQISKYHSLILLRYLLNLRENFSQDNLNFIRWLIN